MAKSIASASIVSAALALFVSAYSFPANAQNIEQQLTYCANQGNVYAPDLVIDGCTGVIQSGQLNQTGLAIAFNLRGIAYRAQSDNTRAVSDFDQAIRLNPQYAEAFMNRGNAHDDLGDNARAMADYDQSIRINPRLAEAFYNRGHAYDRQRNYAHAIADYSEAFRLNPQHFRALTNRAFIHYKQRDYARAIADFDRVIELNQRDWHYINRGLAYYAQRDYARAIADCDQAIRMVPNNDASLYLRGVARLRLGQTAEGQADIAAATALNANVSAQFAGYGVTP